MRYVVLWVICGGIGMGCAAPLAPHTPIAQNTPVQGDVGKKKTNNGSSKKSFREAETVVSGEIEPSLGGLVSPQLPKDIQGISWTCHSLIQGTLPLPADGRVHSVCQQAQMACVSLNAFEVLEKQGQTGLSKSEQKNLKKFLQYQVKQWIQSCRIAHQAYKNPSVVAEIFAEEKR